MVAWPILAAREAGAGRVAAIVSPGHDISAGLPEGTETVVQPEADGTGGAIRAALPLIEESGDGPRPLRRPPADLRRDDRRPARRPRRRRRRGDDADDRARRPRLLRPRRPRRRRARSSASSRPKPPATPSAEELAIREINAGTYAFDAGPLAEALAGLSNDNAQGEYYLTDVFPALREAGPSRRRPPRRRPRA